jgi:hypothetical protein
MKRVYLVSLLCLFSLASFGNEEDNFIPGQVIRTDGSRLSTLVKVPVNANEKTVMIRDSETGEDMTLESTEIRSITVVEAGKTVQYVYTNYVNERTGRKSSAVWLKTLSWGELLLYSGEWNNKTIYFLRHKGNDIPVQLSPNNYKAIILPLISDHTELVNDLEKTNHSYNTIASLLDEYNAWKSFE